jgi:D-alanine-D-alanine ligase
MKHVAVIMGGWSAERDVSLTSGKAITSALLQSGYEVTSIDMAPEMPVPELIDQLIRAKPDVVFNALHGRFGEDGCLQGLLELMKIPYTHSGVLASSIAMDKPMAKRIFEAAGLRCPKGKLVTRAELLQGDPLPRPYVIKPFNEGSSVGVKLAFENENFMVTDEQWAYGETVLVEEYIPGRELTVAVLDDKPLGVTELRISTGFYDYEHKYTDGKTEHLCPAPLPKDKYEEAMALGLAAHRALGCRGLSRADFRYDDTNGKSDFYLLEVNTQPGMTPLSLSPELAAYAGISFNQLVQILVEGAQYG